MEKKLTIAHIAPYLPYGLEIWFSTTKGVKTHTMSASNIGDVLRYTTNYKPILRPLSQLTQEIEHNGERFVPADRLEYTYSTLGVRATIEQLSKDNRWVNHCEYLLIQHLLEWHFDINNLLSDGLAIEKGAEG